MSYFMVRVFLLIILIGAMVLINNVGERILAFKKRR